MDGPVLHGGLAPDGPGNEGDWEKRLRDPRHYGERRAQVQQLCQELLQGRRLLVASNRGPLEYFSVPGGELRARRGRGGAASALYGIYQAYPVTWVACAMSDSDREALANAGNNLIRSPLPGQDLLLRFISPAKDEYHKYYNIVSNPLLWFLQHMMWNYSWTPNITEATYDAWNRGYTAVNHSFASAVVEEARREDGPPLILLQDYHLYLAPAFIRKEIPASLIVHFTHVPWPDASHWQLLPRSMREPILRGLCASDIAGFQTMLSVQNFLHTCHTSLEDARVDYHRARVDLDGHTTWARRYPLSVDVAGLRRTLASPQVRSYMEALLPKCGEKNIVRIDRAEPSRNIIRGFKAFDRLLHRHPELIGKVRFLAFLSSSRNRIWEYQRYCEEVIKLAAFINRKHGNETWQPVELVQENNHFQNLAALSLYDVLLVNPVMDGMSLAAKEGPIANTRDGVLVLSEGTGAYEQLREGALCVCPSDLEGTVQALYQALTMPQEERRRMIEVLRGVVEADDPVLWVYRQLTDAGELAAARAGGAPPGTPPPPEPPSE